MFLALIDNILSWMIFFPLIGAAVILVLPSSKSTWIKWTGVIATLPPWRT